MFVFALWLVLSFTLVLRVIKILLPLRSADIKKVDCIYSIAALSALISLLTEVVCTNIQVDLHLLQNLLLFS